MIAFLDKIDTALFLFFNSMHAPPWDGIMVFVSAKYSWVPLYAFILYLLIRKYRKHAWMPVLAIIVVITLCDQASVHLFKNVFERLRPCHNPDIQHMVHMVNNSCGGRFGFVSSHASNTFGLALFTLLVFKNRYYTAGILFWASWVSYSRVYLGRHYPGDIVAGAALGALIGYLCFKGFEYLRVKMLD